MNIAIVSNVVYPYVKGGAEKRIHEIGTRLVQRGHDLTIYTRHWWEGPEVIEHEGMTLRAVSPQRELHAGERRSIFEAVEFGKDVVNPLRRNGESHELIIVSVFPYFPVFGASLGNILNDTPVATTWLEVWEDYWYDYLGKFGVFGKTVERLSTLLPQNPIAISKTVARDLHELGFDESEVRIIPGGINFDQIRDIKPAADGFDVLYAGRLLEHKNVDMLIDAFDNLAEEFDMTLGIIGDGPQYNELRAQATSLTNGDRISFLGFLDEYDSVLSHMHAADLFVSPSTREGFGITLAEAMATDCTVLTVDHPDSAGSEVVGKGGFVVEPNKLAIQKGMRRHLEGERPQQNPIEAASKYDWDEIAIRAESIYQEIIDSHNTSI